MDKDELGANDRNKKVGEGKVSFKHGLGKFCPFLEMEENSGQIPKSHWNQFLDLS